MNVNQGTSTVESKTLKDVKTMKAAVVNEFKQELEIKDVPIPDLEYGEILVKIKACGVCPLRAAAGRRACGTLGWAGGRHLAHGVRRDRRGRRRLHCRGAPFAALRQRPRGARATCRVGAVLPAGASGFLCRAASVSSLPVVLGRGSGGRLAAILGAQRALRAGGPGGIGPHHRQQHRLRHFRGQHSALEHRGERNAGPYPVPAAGARPDLRPVGPAAAAVQGGQLAPIRSDAPGLGGERGIGVGDGAGDVGAEQGQCGGVRCGCHRHRVRLVVVEARGRTHGFT